MGDFSATIPIVIAKQLCSGQLYQATLWSIFNMFDIFMGVGFLNNSNL